MISFLGQKQLEKKHLLLPLSAEALPRWPVENALA
jgi:hypothetical protein